MILVTGATGNIGRELARELDARRVPFRVLVRSLERAAGLPASAERFVGDLAKPGSLASAFANVEELFLLTQGTDVDLTVHALAAASAAKVRHLVHLSSAHVLIDPLPAMGQWHHAREALIRASGIPATFLRPGGFMSNAFDWLPTLREGGFVLDPLGPGRYAPIDPADIAAVAALALTESGHEGQAYALTGSQSFTLAEQVQVLAQTIGRRVDLREVATPEEAVRFRFPNGAPPKLAAAITEAWTLMRADRVGFRSDTFERLMGRAPRTFADWCVRHGQAFQEAIDAGASRKRG